MNKINRLLILLSFFCLTVGCKTQKSLVLERPANWAKKIELKEFHNLYQLDKDLYRSEQPSPKGFVLLDSMGILTVVNLRNDKADKSETGNSDLIFIQVPIDAWTISYENVVESLKQITLAKKPVLLHCVYGSDRTGCVAAAYRMVYCGWSKEAAIKELREGGYGFHEKYFPNILELLNTINIEQLKKDIAK